MRVLPAYLLRNNLFLLFLILCVGVGIFILADMFERLDDFLAIGIEPSTIAYYFLLKLPNIVYLVMPAVYLVSVIVQLHLLERNRELTALAAGGIRPAVFVYMILVYSICLACLLFIFGQIVSIMYDREASRIWQEKVRGNVLAESYIEGLWFKEGRNIIHIDKVYVERKVGSNIIVYKLDEEGISIDEIIKAEEFSILPQGIWKLENVVRLVPSEYTAHKLDSLELDIRQDLQAFQVVGRQMGMDPGRLTMYELYAAIRHLEQAGSNVEMLRTAFFAKPAYAFSIIVMGLIALIVTRSAANIYKAVAVGILVVFFYHTANSVCISMGEKNIISPVAGAWSADIFFLCAGIVWLSVPYLARKLRRG
ncbi:MAG: LptF/LptG family permease [Desulfovibrio sp.]|jgi:lipopolysaccharide export system permease protein|nr:LptF/LptG family permease [Desulfovibrio sp.]